MNGSSDKTFDAELGKILDIGREVNATATVAGTTDELVSRRLSAEAIQAAASLGVSMGREARTELMNALGSPLKIPRGGFLTGQSHLFVTIKPGEPKDLRLLDLMKTLTSTAASRAASTNLRLAHDLVVGAHPRLQLRPFLVLTTAAREAGKSVTDRSTKPVHTFDGGGLDFISQNVPRLGLPSAMTRLWTKDSLVSAETNRRVHPAIIPGMHQVVAYAAQMRLSYADLLDWVGKEGPGKSHSTSHHIGETARRIWQAYAFLAPGGSAHHCGQAPRHGRSFGVRTASQYLTCLSPDGGFDFNSVVAEERLHRTYWVISAKMRVVESLFFEHLLDRAGFPEDPFTS